jgi:hypothetical protein
MPADTLLQQMAPSEVPESVSVRDLARAAAYFAHRLRRCNVPARYAKVGGALPGDVPYVFVDEGDVMFHDGMYVYVAAVISLLDSNSFNVTRLAGKPRPADPAHRANAAYDRPAFEETPDHCIHKVPESHASMMDMTSVPLVKKVLFEYREDMFTTLGSFCATALTVFRRDMPNDDAAYSLQHGTRDLWNYVRAAMLGPGADTAMETAGETVHSKSVEANIVHIQVVAEAAFTGAVMPPPGWRIRYHSEHEHAEYATPHLLVFVTGSERQRDMHPFYAHKTRLLTIYKTCAGGVMTPLTTRFDETGLHVPDDVRDGCFMVDDDAYAEIQRAAGTAEDVMFVMFYQMKHRRRELADQYQVVSQGRIPASELCAAFARGEHTEVVLYSGPRSDGTISVNDGTMTKGYKLHADCKIAISPKGFESPVPGTYPNDIPYAWKASGAVTQRDPYVFSGAHEALRFIVALHGLSDKEHEQSLVFMNNCGVNETCPISLMAYGHVRRVHLEMLEQQVVRTLRCWCMSPEEALRTLRGGPAKERHAFARELIGRVFGIGNDLPYIQEIIYGRFEYDDARSLLATNSGDCENAGLFAFDLVRAFRALSFYEETDKARFMSPVLTELHRYLEHYTVNYCVMTVIDRGKPGDAPTDVLHVVCMLVPRAALPLAAPVVSPGEESHYLPILIDSTVRAFNCSICRPDQAAQKEAYVVDIESVIGKGNDDAVLEAYEMYDATPPRRHFIHECYSHFQAICGADLPAWGRYMRFAGADGIAKPAGVPYRGVLENPAGTIYRLVPLSADGDEAAMQKDMLAGLRHIAPLPTPDVYAYETSFDGEHDHSYLRNRCIGMCPQVMTVVDDIYHMFKELEMSDYRRVVKRDTRLPVTFHIKSAYLKQDARLVDACHATLHSELQKLVVLCRAKRLAVRMYKYGTIAPDFTIDIVCVPADA